MDTQMEAGTMRKTEMLTDRAIRNAKPDKGKTVKRLLDGDRLYLQATTSLAGGVNRNWVFRYEHDFKRHDYGIGPYPTVSLAEARSRAGDLRLMLIDGIDPLRERNQAKKERLAAKAKEMKARTFEQCTEDYFRVHAPSLKNEKYRKQWLRNMEVYVYPTIGKLNVGDIDVPHIEQTLSPIWNTIGDTASKIQAQIKKVFDFAIGGKYRTGDNPARRELIAARLGKGNGNGGKHHAAMPFTDVPAFIAELRAEKSLAALALEFTILTAARTGEVRGATWDEIDLKARTWIIPGERMKKGREHRVPLTDRTVEILEGLKRHGKFVFADTKGQQLTVNYMLRLLYRLRPNQTVHGFRSSFRDWAAERTNYPEFVYELCLAHIVGTEVLKAYRRTDVFERRVRLMKQWADFLAKPRPPKTGDVHHLHERRAS